MDGVASGVLRPSDALADVSDYVHGHRALHRTASAASRTISLADAALGAEGRTVVDPYTRRLSRWVAEGRMTGDEAAAFLVTFQAVGVILVEQTARVEPGYWAATSWKP